MLKLTYDGLFDMGMETDLRGPNSEEGKFDWFFLEKKKEARPKNFIFSHLALFLLIPDLVSIRSGAIASVNSQVAV